FNESHPVWSPDGKMIAFTGRRASTESGANIALVYLKAEDDDKTARDRKLEKALDKMKARSNPGKAPVMGDGEAEKSVEKKADGKKPVAIDFDGLAERVRRITLGEGSANQLFWSPDSKRLAFTGNYEGKPGTYVIDVADSYTPKSLTPTAGTQATWLKQGNQIVWLVGGVPTSTPGTAAPTAAAAAPTAPAPIAKGGKKGAKGGGGFV